MSTEIATIQHLVDVRTGEALDPTPENAAEVIRIAREVKGRIDGAIRDATDVIAAESQRMGTKTLHFGAGKVVLTGGESTEYDVDDLREALTAADCPEERINAAIKEEVVTTYKVDRAVLKQLAAANPDYRAAIELAERKVAKRLSVKVDPA